MDQCKHCVARGDFDYCQSLDCSHHETWYARQLRSRIPAQPQESKERAENSPASPVQQLNYAIALLREWVDDPGGKVCNDLYQRSRDWLAQQHN